MNKSQKLSITIGHLYADLMNIYGDNGNIICLKKRLEWRGIDCKILNLPIGYKLEKGEVDLYFFGGGQDQAQTFLAQDLLSSQKGPTIKADIEKGVPLLSICGGYQLLGEYYQPHEGPKIIGLDIFPVFTKASFDRMIGNLIIEVMGSELGVMSKDKQKESPNPSPLTPNHLVGFENHSGKTYLKPGATPLGNVITGFGNNGEDKFEGCIYKNAIGCYMHGSLLPKNPQLADWLIKKALEVKYGKEIELEPLDDDVEQAAHQAILTRFS